MGITRREMVMGAAALAAAAPVLAGCGAAKGLGAPSTAAGSGPDGRVRAYLYEDGLIEFGPQGFEPDPGRTVEREFEDYFAELEEGEGGAGPWCI